MLQHIISGVRQGSHFKGEIGDRLHAVLCASGYNLRWLLGHDVLAH
jgi:IS5 family transposase